MEIKTMTGKTPEEVLQIMTAVLPVTAYKKAEGMPGNFTAIKSPYLTEALTEEVVSLPIFPELTEGQIREVGQAVREFYSR